MINEPESQTMPNARRGLRPGVVVCFSHLRWDFVYQRPHHLMSRYARTVPVIYWEEAVSVAGSTGSWLETRRCRQSGVVIATPYIGDAVHDRDRADILSRLLEDFVGRYRGPVLKWYYTPMMLEFSRSLEAFRTVYDCMDELTAFAFAPPALAEMERTLMEVADVMFAGGQSLFDAKKARHANIHAFPSSVDRRHFAAAREICDEPRDQACISRPRLGFFGVVDERIDLGLLEAVAQARPDWSLVIVGPVAKIDASSLPRRPNIHYLGPKPYDALPLYLAGWDVALMPFAINPSTRFISPTKTPEYLAGGRPVVSTPIGDVVRRYGRLPGVEIADGVAGFVQACARAIDLASQTTWLAAVDATLAEDSWDNVFDRMQKVIFAAQPGETSLQPSGASPMGPAASRPPRSVARPDPGAFATDPVARGLGASPDAPGSAC